ncbi:MAG: hypothetical protein LBG70_02605, partial [Bifidobacteriaceae bacterium]|nr:hypothetical protein [Bifidobacteriaceae bacterium]
DYADFSGVTAALAAARAVLDAAAPTQEQATAALAGLVNAVAALTANPAIAEEAARQAAEQARQAAEAAAQQAAEAAAKKAAEDAKVAADQAAAKANLDTVKSVLTSTANSYGNLNAADFTEATWTEFAAALTAAKAAVASTTATTQTVNAAMTRLLTARAGLVNRPATPPSALPTVATKTIKVSGKAHKRTVAPKVTVSITLSTGKPGGTVLLYVGKTVVKEVTVKANKTTVKLPKKYAAKTIKVKAKYFPSSAAKGTAKASKTVKVKVKK